MAKNDSTKTTQTTITKSVKKLPQPRAKKTPNEKAEQVLVVEEQKVVTNAKSAKTSKPKTTSVAENKKQAVANDKAKSGKKANSAPSEQSVVAVAINDVDNMLAEQNVKSANKKRRKAVSNEDSVQASVGQDAVVVKDEVALDDAQNVDSVVFESVEDKNSVDDTIQVGAPRQDTKVEDNQEDGYGQEIAQSEQIESKPQSVKKKKKSKKRFTTPLTRVEAEPSQGLSTAEVEERIDRGLNNEQPNIVTKSYAGIFRSNVLTLFNILNFFLATMILIYGELKNALFMGTVLVNMIVGIVQEIRSKLTLEKMSILSTPKIRVVREGKVVEIDGDNLVLDDIVVLRQGEQVPADSVVVEGMCEVNESLLTGEQDDVHKEVGSELLSGSFIQAGECRARARAVGKDNYTSKLMAEAKQFKKPKSELMKSINWIIRIVTIAIFPIGILMFLTNLKTTATINQAVTGTVASIVGMIPEGLVMLTSIALAAGIIKLAKRRTLVQDLYCIETLARVDVLCLDKTGTITEGSMQVEETHVYSTKYGFVDDIMTNMVEALGASGATFEAFANYFKSSEKYDVVKTIPFSSARKWSGADFGDKGRFIVGAPEFVLKSRFGLVESDAIEYTSQGYRAGARQDDGRAQREYGRKQDASYRSYRSQR